MLDGRRRVLARPLYRGEDAFNPVGQRHVGSHELPPGRDVPGSKCPRRASCRETVRQAGAHFGDEQALELVCRSEFESPIRRRDDRLGFAVHEPGVGGSFPGAVDPHESFEEVAIRERLRLGAERSNRQGLREGAPDGGLVRGPYPVQNEGWITGFERGGSGGHHGPFHRVAMGERGRRNRDADKQSYGKRGAAKHRDVAVRHLVLHRRTSCTARARENAARPSEFRLHRRPGVRLAPSKCSRMYRMEHTDPVCGVCGLIPHAPRLSGTTHLVARSAAMQTLLKRVARFAANSAPVTVLGETGAGKEVVARVLHANSPRAKQPFVAVNVAALPAELLESELFGHAKGAFTGAATARRGLFEAADKGTLFLDEIGEMPLPLQAKLLRALQDGELRRVGESESYVVDVRVVCATHRDLAQRIREGAFRQDLLYRLKVLTIEMPALRERRDDILPLAVHFLAEEKARARGFTTSARKILLNYGWPGNVRELQNAVKHGAALAGGAEVDAEDLPDELNRPAGRRPLETAARTPRSLHTLGELEREHILRVLDACGDSQSEAARVLGIARNTLWRKLRTYS